MRTSGRGRSAGALARALVRAFAVLLLALLVSCDRASASTAAIASTAPVDSGSDSVPAPSAVPSASQSAAAVAPVAPPYDLAADLADRTAHVRAEFGATTPVRVEGTAFLLVSPDHGPLFAPSVSFVHRALAAFFNGRFRGPPDRAVTVCIYSSKDAFDKAVAKDFPHIDPDDFMGLYRRSTRQIVVYASEKGVTSVAHELAHSLAASEFASAPAWFDEGVASLFEAPVLPRPGEIHGVYSKRIDRVRDALESPRERNAVRLDALFGMSNHDFVSGDYGLHYGMARAACLWLDGRGLLWPFWRAWRDGFADDRTGEKAFERVVGQTPAQANEAWTKWLRTL